MKNRKKILSCLIASALIVSNLPLTFVNAAETTSATTSSTETTGAAGENGPNIDISGAITALVADGTITQAQGDKISATLSAGMGAGPQDGAQGGGAAGGTSPAGGPLASLVTDNTITADQAQKVLDKLFGGMGGAGGGLPGANTQGVTATATDVNYVTGSTSASQTLDVYLPTTGKGPFPVIVAFHGGGFKMGDKNSGEINDELLGLTKGYAVVCVNYRLSGEAIFPGAIYDAKAAIRYLRANASKYNLDPNRIAAWGDSAGGNIVSMLGTSGGVSELEDLSQGNADQKSNVQAVVDFYGPINFSIMDDEFIADGKSQYATHNSATSFESDYMGAGILTVPEKCKESNPTTYISQDDPPFFVENGSADPQVPTAQSVNFAAALTKVLGSNKVTYIQLEGAGHGGDQFDSASNLAKVYSWLDNYLKKR